MVWTSNELFIQRIPRDQLLLDVVLPKLKAFYFVDLLPALYEHHKARALACDKSPGIVMTEEWIVDIMHHFFPATFSQSTIDSRDGSSACTVITCHAVYSVLAGALPLLPATCVLSTPARTAFVSLMRAGNAEYDKANLHGQLLGVYDTLRLYHSLG